MKEDQESAKPHKVTESRRKPNKFKGRQRILKEDKESADQRKVKRNPEGSQKTKF